MTAPEIAAALGGRREGRGWRCQCPVHGGRSLVISDGREGQLLVKCWAGCAARDILAELRRLGLIAGKTDHACPHAAEIARRHAAAAERWLGEGRCVRIAIPPEPGTDIADVLAGRAYARTVEASDVAA